jgi:drug/metabolite transporter (DMT)-like permease
MMRQVTIREPKRPGVASALIAAALFGASTPLAKLLVDDVAPVLLAGLLYVGSGVGLSAWWLLRHLVRHRDEPRLTRRDLPWLAGAIGAGGVVGPVLLMLGLVQLPAANASLLLNLEGVFTALLAWFVFRENFDRRIALGMLLIVAGGVLLSSPTAAGWQASWGSIAVVGACLAWALDNNLTRKISAGDPVQIAGIKGLVAGFVNTGIALAAGETLPQPSTALAAVFVGAFGYGVSLVLFVLALRHLGSARTGAYFSTAPFIGAALSMVLLYETPEAAFWLAAAFMGAGVWLHLAERHEHLHTHEPLAHSHRHSHDAHHQHAHDFPWDGTEPHSHLHEHAPLVHHHAHYPDIHHRHRHEES